MEFKQLIETIARNKNVTPLEETKDCFVFYAEDYRIACSQIDKFILIESNLGPLSNIRNADSLTRHLLSNSIGFIRDKRACLSINKDAQHYSLHQRVSLEGLTVMLFESNLEQFATCLRYLSEEIKPFLQNDLI